VITRFARLLTVCVIAVVGAPMSIAQVPAPTVQWSTSIKPATGGVQGRKATLELSALIQDGWHVYALTQVPGGPTPLRVTLEDESIARVSGVASGTAPQKRHDASFDLDTEFYTGAFALRFQLETHQSLAVGQSIPVSVRFQTCSDRECQPPKTVRLLASIDATARE
jgi:hypothetical protein